MGRNLLAGALAFFIAAPAWSAGTTTASFLKMGVGARGVAMGGSQTAAVEDNTALYWNPAALDRMNQKEIGFMHNQYFLGVTHDVLNYAHPTTNHGTLGVGLSMLNVDDVTGYGKTGQKTGNLTVQDTLLTLGWGKRWDTLKLPEFYTGMNVKYLQKTLGDHTASTFLADFGMYHQIQGRWLKGLQTGAVIQNLSGGLKFINEKTPLPRTMKIGAAYPLFGESVTVAADYVSVAGEKASLNLGADYRVWEILAFRLGYKGQTGGFGGGLAYGVGLSRGSMRMDYAFVPYGDLGTTHRVSVGYRFGATKKAARVEAQVEKSYRRAMSAYGQGYLVDAYMQATQVIDVAPWHAGSKRLMEKVQTELREMEGLARKSEFEGQIDKHYERGVAHFDKDEMIQAKREFEVILTLMPDHDGAKKYLEKIAERFRNMAGNFFEGGMRLFAEGQYQEAKESFQKVLVMDPGHGAAQDMIAKTDGILTQLKSQQAEKERMDEARRLFQSAVSDVEAKRYEEANRKLDQVLELAPEMQEAKRYKAMTKGVLARALFDEGMKAMQGGNWNEAVRQFRKALELKPDYTEAQNVMEKLVARQGEQKKNESIQLYKQGLETLLTGDKEKTRELWQRAWEIWPENLDAKRGLERLSSGKGGRKG